MNKLDVGDAHRLMPGAIISALEDAVPMPHAGNEWEPPIPFDVTDVPPFPIAALPPSLRAFVAELAVATQTPPDLAGLLSLGTCGAALAKRVRVRVKEGWREPLNLYTLVSSPPGSRKSAVFNEVTAPLVELEREEAKRLKPVIEEARTRSAIVERCREQTIARAAKATNEAERKKASVEVAAIARQLVEHHVPAEPKLILADVTAEKLGSVLADQRGRVALMSAEGGLFEIMGGRYSQAGPSFDVLLKAHSGDDLRVDRVNRPSEHVPAPALTIALAVQPDVVQALSDHPAFRGRGLLGRFLYGMPPSLLGDRDIDAAPMTAATRNAYRRMIRALFALPTELDEDGQMNERVLALSPAAWTQHRDFQRWLEPQLAETGALGAMGDWAGKLAGAVARIAGILHGVSLAGRSPPWEQPIQAETMSCALEIGRYLIPHARSAYLQMGEDEAKEGARYLMRWIERSKPRAFSQRELHRATRGRFKVVIELERALAVLVDHGHVRLEPVEHSGPGRRPSPVYAVHPSVLGQNGQNGQNGGAV